MTDQKDRVAFITGGAQGVGRAVALRLAEKGFNRLTIMGRNKDTLAEAAAELERFGAEVFCAAADLADPEATKRAATQAYERFGATDVLCNCAGATDRGSILDTSIEVFDRIFDTNVRGNFFLIQNILPQMIARKSGVIINISSMLAYGGVPHLAAYSASKGALNTLTRNVANAVRHDRVRVHAINLGWTLTPAEHSVQTSVHGMPEDWAEIEGRKQPFGRLLTADDPAALCCWLASDEAAMMTGTVIDLEQWVVGTLDAR